LIHQARPQTTTAGNQPHRTGVEAS
jgi:hypothetical protein